MNPIMKALNAARNSTSPFIAIFTWAATWVFNADNPTGQVIKFYDSTDPLKLGFGAILVIGSLFLNFKKEKPVDLVDVVEE